MRIPAIALLAPFLLPLPMMAETIYTYTGGSFTAVGTDDPSGNLVSSASIYTTSDFVTGWFAVPTAIAPNSWVDILPGSFSFSDGVQTITDSNSEDPIFSFETDPSGNFLYWGVFLLTRDTSTGVFGEVNTSGQVLFPGSEQFEGFDQGTLSNPDTGRNYYFGETLSPGTWTESETPEPSSIVLLMTGLAGIASAMRRNFSR